MIKTLKAAKKGESYFIKNAEGKEVNIDSVLRGTTIGGIQKISNDILDRGKMLERFGITGENRIEYNRYGLGWEMIADLGSSTAPIQDKYADFTHDNS